MGNLCGLQPKGTVARPGHEESVMKCLVLGCDYDGTLAHDGVLDDATAAALDRFRASGRRLVMVTGRE